MLFAGFSWGLLAAFKAAAAACLLALTATGRVASCTGRSSDGLFLSIFSLFFSVDFDPDPEHA